MAESARPLPGSSNPGPSPFEPTGDRRGWLEHEVFPAFLTAQRWFAEKNSVVERLRLVDAVEVGDRSEAFLAIVEIEPAHQMYFIPFALGPAGSDADSARWALARVQRDERDEVVFDALARGELPHAMFDDIRAGRRRPSIHGGAFVAHATTTLANLDLPARLSVRALTVEQSNTSIVLGDAVMLKGYRRVFAGPQAELEIARFLDAVGYKNTPALLGYIEFESPQREPVALCIAQTFAKNQGDGWAVTLAHLAQREGIAAAAPDDDAAFEKLMHTLGKRTAELHRAFATPIGDLAFEPEPTTRTDTDAWAAQARATAQTALESLERERDRIPSDMCAAVESLFARRAEVFARLDVPPPADATLMKTRYHGDYHLGQVLVTGDDFLIVDFEGEPGRDPAVRRRKSSPLRDVAGMLRSLNYAAVTGKTSAHWERRNVDAFLAGYRWAIDGVSSYPSDAGQARRLLDLFVLEKAFYELSYELANRPDWLRIPLEGIRAILDADEYAITAN